ncbi:hypothetical protein AQUCO_01400145v1 [Aquilegia coerulea]|uniref:O-fucosyltransferase family protein n=1 Tax=Aquilegia coerulea TaxID=218851 RepID=A0A2G5DUS6_AQUCA|nr:hypothetical protein AQUCO_01400145v1 [Aquilegia coerulea]
MSMHGQSRLSYGSVASSPPSSPPSSPRLRHGRSRKIVCNGTSNNSNNPKSNKKILNFTERLVYFIVSTVFKRRGVLLFAPLLYISGMLMYMGSLSLEGASGIGGRRLGVDQMTPPGSRYRSPEVFENLWPFMERDSNHPNSSNALMTTWHIKSNQSWKPCANRSTSLTGLSEVSGSNGFLIIEANGGLNQQRISICDAVAVAGLLNATLVIPMFHLNSVWRDSSKFGDIFDEEFFIYALRNNVKIIRELPEEILERFDHNISNIVNLRVKAWSSPKHYLQKVLPKLLELRAVRIAPFSNRLAHAVPSNIQDLRCLANYEALRFSRSIRLLAERMVDRMVKNSSISGGKYISVHLRFEEDMVAFSCCTYDGGDEEKREMDIARERSWRGKFKKHGRIIRPGVIRMDGKCPLTPLEVGIMLRAMGFDNTTSVYVAAGRIYRAGKYMAPLRQMFPLLETKETLATELELAPFQVHCSTVVAYSETYLSAYPWVKEKMCVYRVKVNMYCLNYGTNIFCAFVEGLRL